MVNKCVRYERLASCVIVFPGTEEMYFKVAVMLLDYQFLCKGALFRIYPSCEVSFTGPNLSTGRNSNCSSYFKATANSGASQTP